MGTIRARVLISGRVQGVYFRESARTLATQVGVTGWVRNLRNGRVELRCEGEEAVVRRLIAWCHEGPPAARVSHVETEWGEPTGEFDAFRIERTPF